ncbi:MAG: hypothetical protein J7J38_03175 [Candidatus Aenigmarchaeota archaeon]|nr:hypothetical protein [Candidatus Aenigmarchaeota archaeon]
MDNECRHFEVVAGKKTKNQVMRMSILKYWKIILLLLFLFGSIVAISPWEKPGVIVKNVGKNSDFYKILEPNDIIYEINGEPATVERINNMAGMTFLKTSKNDINIFVNNSNITVGKRPFSNLRFGLDLEGGILAVVEPVSNVSDQTLYDVKSILEQRMSSLRESSFQIVKYEDKKFIQIQIAGGTENDIDNLINTTGVFEGKIPMPVKFVNGSGKLKFGDENEWIDVKYHNESIIINNQSFSINETFSLRDTNFTVWNITKNGAVIAATVYINDGIRKDIVKVHTDPQHSYIQPGGNWYKWSFDVEVSPESARRFYNAVKNLKRQYSDRGSYLESKIYLFLDGKEVSNLSIGSTLQNKPTTIATVSGSAETKEDAIEEKRWLQLILRSGALPTNLHIVSIKKISPKLGQNFFKDVGMAMIIAVLVVSFVVFLRYRNLKLSLPIILTCLSEVIIIIGSSVVIGWTLDLAAIAGIIAVIGTGVDQQIIIVDEILSGERTWSLKSKIKRAFFMIFGAAGTTLGAMLPLMTLGFGLLRGFAITTSLGILIGIFITRPAFADIVERLMK